MGVSFTKIRSLVITSTEGIKLAELIVLLLNIVLLVGRKKAFLYVFFKPRAYTTSLPVSELLDRPALFDGDGCLPHVVLNRGQDLALQTSTLHNYAALASTRVFHETDIFLPVCIIKNAINTLFYLGSVLNIFLGCLKNTS